MPDRASASTLRLRNFAASRTPRARAEAESRWSLRLTRAGRFASTCCKHDSDQRPAATGKSSACCVITTRFEGCISPWRATRASSQRVRCGGYEEKPSARLVPRAERRLAATCPRLTTTRVRATLAQAARGSRKKIVRHAWAWFVAAASFGCASSTPVTPTTEPAIEEEVTIVPVRSDVVCEVTRPTGSKIAVRQCSTRAESERVSEASQEWMRSGGAHGSPYYVPDPADPRARTADDN